MIDYAAKLGADCAFFIVNRPVYAEGIGEKMQPVDLDLKGWYLAIVRPAIPVSTKEAFSLITPCYPAHNCRDVVMQPVETWRGLLTNDFEKSVFAIHRRSVPSRIVSTIWVPSMRRCLAPAVVCLGCSVHR